MSSIWAAACPGWNDFGAARKMAGSANVMELDAKNFAFDNDPAVTLDANFGPLKVNVIKTGLNWR
jgi:hypothetical protein